MFQRGHVEVDQEADSQPGQFHVGEELRLVDALDLFDSLELEQHGVFAMTSARKPQASVESLYDIGTSTCFTYAMPRCSSS